VYPDVIATTRLTASAIAAMVNPARTFRNDNADVTNRETAIKANDMKPSPFGYGRVN
jgi:hypothetical protein